MNRPRIIIAGTNSGCGKTTVSAGLMAALIKKGIRVQPFKVGPDYLDPILHTFVTGRYSRNLDSWLLDEKTLMYLFCKNSTRCDISVIEGVMGFYDGFDGSCIEGSTAHVSRILKSPVILVVNARGMSLSVAAMVKGFMDFKGGADVRGVILNKISSHALFLYLKDIIEENTGVRVLGYIPQSEDYVLPERHLGLVPGGEVPDLKDKIERLTEVVSKTIDLELLMRIAKNTPELEIPAEEPAFLFKKSEIKARIAVAMDSAFNFYYRDNLELLEALGADLVYFSPLNDERLPEGIDGIYFGGGYPEIFAEGLLKNYSMREDVRFRLFNGLPAYAECGGLMYLCRTLKDMQGNTFEMSGVFPAQCEMTVSLQHFGYVNINILENCTLGEPGYTTRAHEFHYSIINMDESHEKLGIYNCYEVSKQKRKRENLRWRDGWKLKNTLAGYPHIHFWSNPELARRLVENCAASRKKG
ncbi:MAG: cobyrinate a,c-diamide synthase [Firmicutes bacterium]|nr:cobyrinate a,c-diamide synthase [Bacillota bacterium]